MCVSHPEIFGLAIWSVRRTLPLFHYADIYIYIYIYVKKDTNK